MKQRTVRTADTRKRKSDGVKITIKVRRALSRWGNHLGNRIYIEAGDARGKRIDTTLETEKDAVERWAQKIKAATWAEVVGMGFKFERRVF